MLGETTRTEQSAVEKSRVATQGLQQLRTTLSSTLSVTAEATNVLGLSGSVCTSHFPLAFLAFELNRRVAVNS